MLYGVFPPWGRALALGGGGCCARGFRGGTCCPGREPTGVGPGEGTAQAPARGVGVRGQSRIRFGAQCLSPPITLPFSTESNFPKRI